MPQKQIKRALSTGLLAFAGISTLAAESAWGAPILAADGISIDGGSSASGRITYDASSDGLIIFGRTGNTNDFALYSADGGTILANPKGTRDIAIGNSGAGNTLFRTTNTHTFTVGGTTKLTLNSSGASVAGNLNVSGPTWVNTFEVMGGSTASLTGALNVSGAASLASTLGTTGLHTASGGVLINGGHASSGRITYDASSDGLIIFGRTGNTNDFALYSADGGTILANPKGTRDIAIGNSGAGNTLFRTTNTHTFMVGGTTKLTLNSSGAIVAGNLNVSGPTSVNTFEVMGGSTASLTGALNVSGAASLASTLGVTGLIAASSGIAIDGGTGGPGRIYSDGANGTTLWAKSGSSTDFVLTNSSGVAVLSVAPASTAVTFPGAVSMSSTLTVDGETTLHKAKFGSTAYGNGIYFGHKDITHVGTYDYALAQFEDGTTKLNAQYGTEVSIGVGGAALMRVRPDLINLDRNVVVAGDISASTVKANGWQIEDAPDYVFEKSYKLASLEKVESFVKENKHLPEIPSAKKMKEEGLDLVKMNFNLLKKVEELTLYAIEQNKRSGSLEKEVKELRKTLAALSTRGDTDRPR